MASISPSSLTIRSLIINTFAVNVQSLSASGFSGTITWSVDGINGGNASVGTITLNGTNASYSPPNITSSHTIKATDGTNNASISVVVTAVLPNLPHYPDDLTRDKTVLSSEAMDTTKVFRIKSAARRAYKLTFKGRTYDEYSTIETFHEVNRTNYFYYDDAIRNITSTYWIDSKLHSTSNSSVDFDFDFDILEKIV